MTVKNTARKCYTYSVGDNPVPSHRILTLLVPCSVDFTELTGLMKQVSHKVVGGGGIVRSIQNHGVRDLPHRFRAKYADKEGNRYYKKGRFISVFYDANPNLMKQVEGILTLNEQVLRNTHLKARNKLWYVNIAREDRNPYIQKVLEMEAAQAADGAPTEQNSQADEDGVKLPT